MRTWALLVVRHGYAGEGGVGYPGYLPLPPRCSVMPRSSRVLPLRNFVGCGPYCLGSCFRKCLCAR